MNQLLRLSALALVVSGMAACATHVEGGGGGGGGGGSGCPAPDPGMCLPSTACVDGLQQTGEASCVDGQWVCAQAVCDGCTGSTSQYCSGGQLSSLCCPAGAPCAASQPFCDLGGGACVAGSTCDELDGGPPACTGLVISAGTYDQSCAGDADCAPVFQGDVCSQCWCPNAAINQSALSAYTAALNASGPSTVICNCPAYPPPVCAAGVCTLP
jgi:hypothetical protein